MTQNFESWTTENVYPINGVFDCTSKNLIYLVSCTVCNKQYVGETKKCLKERFRQHRLAALHLEVGNAIGKHFKEYHPYHPVEPDLDKKAQITITPLEQILDQGSEYENKLKRLDREYFWIDTLETYHPYGMNDDKSMIQKLKRAKPMIPFIVPYSTNANAASKVAKRYFSKIQEKFDLNFDHEIITAFKKHKNLKDILVSSNL